MNFNLSEIRIVTFDEPRTLLAFPDAQALHDLRQLVRIGCLSRLPVEQHLEMEHALGVPWDITLPVPSGAGGQSSGESWQGAANHVVRDLGYELSQWLHVGTFHDEQLAPARARGIRTCFLPRPGGGSARDVEMDPPDLVVSDLHELVMRLQAAKDGPWRYRVRAKCADNDVARRFLNWMRYEHGNDLLRITGCIEFRVFQVDPEEIHCEYIFSSRTALDRYLNGAAAALRSKGLDLFSKDEVAFERDTTRLISQGISRAKRDFA